ncbi:MAG: N-acyl homoserine lactone hydrolase [Sphingomonadales bacterium]|jgi:glyoxylase-like metal-dependent hydrolase (beta-lactamase superfamily II)|nr:N-acyl homoserine lactone hydrolase [Sphingomonadales bacterium]
MLKRMLALAAGAVALMGMQAPGAPPPAGRPEMALWRLDCGEARIGNLDMFSDIFAYVGRSKTLTASCYLIRHGDRYLLWDTGFPGSLAGSTTGDESFRIIMRTRLTDQLARIGVRPEQVTFLGISHYHDDHTGQAADFPRATLLIGAADWDVVRGRPETAARFGPWIEGQSRVEPQAGDHDVFGDGSVIMLNTPGHTPGHHSLLVRLPRTGPVLLTGDLYHFTENFESGGVPGFNTNRADTLASMARFREIARNLRARIVIQHEPADIAKLPAFPEAAR